MKENFLKIIEKFKDRKIGVIGDLMLDQFIWGNAERISPEAPVPVVFVEKESFVPGGAGNAANNVAALGGKVFLVGIVGKDIAGQRLLQELKKRKIDITGVIEYSGKATTQKIRIIARGQHIVRIDKENNDSIDDETEEKVINFITSGIKDWDILLIADYSKGFITKNLAQKIINLAEEYQKPIIGDTKSKSISHFKNITLFTPNHREAVEMTGMENLEKAGKAIQKELNCNVLITQGAQGMTLFEQEKIKYFSAKTKEAFDVTGAGDTVAGVISLAVATGANLEEASNIANHAAGIVVGKMGTAVVSLHELKKDLENNG
jgi:rfaE bifunctional protein kinase chain/domain